MDLSFFQAIEKFNLYLRINRNSSSKTIEQYCFHLFSFLKFFHRDIASSLETLEFRAIFLEIPSVSEKMIKKQQQTDFCKKYLTTKLSDITLDVINSFRLYLSQKNLWIKTVNAYMISIRSFCKYLKKNSFQIIDPTSIDLIKQEERKVEFLTHEEIIRLFDSIESSDVRWLRDIAIMECIYSTGLRVSELTALNRRDINLDRLEFAVRGKWRKVRVVYLTDIAAERIRTYFNARTDVFEPAFIRHNFDPTNIPDVTDAEKYRLSRIHITNMIKSQALKAGIIKDVSAHTLRHSFATTLLENGADIRSIQEMLWHKSITTTQVYTHVTNSQLKEVHKKFHK